VAHTLATNTTLTVSYELNDWDDGVVDGVVSYELNDWDDGVEDGVGTFETELAVTF